MANNRNQRKNERRRRSRLNKRMNTIKSNGPLAVSQVACASIIGFPTRRLNTNEIEQILPPFNPNSPLGLNSEKWIEVVEIAQRLYKWTDDFTLLYASIRLEDEAKILFHEQITNWKEFKLALVREFPSSLHRSQFVAELFKRRKENSENFECYVYDIARIANDCNFNLETTINYIISGLDDIDMRNRLIAYNCKSIPEVLETIQSIIVNRCQQPQKKMTSNQEIKTENPSPNNKSSGLLISDSKLQKGQINNSEKLETSAGPIGIPKKVVAGDLVQTVRVETVLMKAFINLASEYTTIQRSEFEKHDWKWKNCKKVRGSPIFLGKISKLVSAGEVEMLIEIHIVEDGIQEFPLVLGRNFLDNSNVCVVKSFGRLEIKFVDETKSLNHNIVTVTTKDQIDTVKQELQGNINSKETIKDTKSDVDFKDDSLEYEAVDENNILKLLNSLEQEFLKC